MSFTAQFEDFIRISEVDDGAFFAGDLFRRKFGSAPPAQKHHLVAFCRGEDGGVRAAGYLHLMPFGDTILVGGGCTDGAVLRALSAENQARVRASGGLLFHLLRHAFDHYGDRCEAFLGYCGDARAEEVDLQAGFVKTEHPRLLVHFHKPLHPVMQRALIAKGAAIGPF